ncbi:MAG: AAA family ATPase [Nitrososphaerota archaeon]|nr:AAA family ATPase [Nitrososphaerota archaeon]MDG6948751.1 AAA family ATPase [Nitrososphaerota archaeon]
MVDQRQVVKNRLALGESFHPTQLWYRGEEYTAVRAEFEAFAMQDYDAAGPHIVVTGAPGMGKTLVVEKVADDLAALAQSKMRVLRTSYINCRREKNEYMILKKMATDFGVNVPPTGWQVNRLLDVVYNMKVNKLVVIDDADLILPKMIDFIGMLTRMPGLGMIMVSNRIGFEELIDDPAVLSSLGKTQVYFKPYSVEALRAILAERTKEAFTSPLDESVLNLCAALAVGKNGDVRYLMGLVGRAATKAENDGADRIAVRHVYEADRETQDLDMTIVLRGMPSTWRYLFLSVIAHHPDTEWRKIYHTFVISGPEAGYEPLSYYRALEALKNLEKAGLVSVQSIRKVGTKVRLIADPGTAKKVLEKLTDERGV